jgi:hypothetical protein
LRAGISVMMWIQAFESVFTGVAAGVVDAHQQ